MSLYKTNIINRFILFTVLFIIQTGILGALVIPTHLLYQFYFFIYPNFGKILLFSFIALGLILKEKVFNLPIEKYTKENVIYLITSFLLIPIFYLVSRQLLTYPMFLSNIPLSLLTHIIILAIPVTLTIGVFGRPFLANFIATQKKLLMICLVLAIIFNASIFFVWNLWPYLSAIVLDAVYWLYKPFIPSLAVIPPRGLFVGNFTVIIEQSCSGIDSIYLFTVLYLLVTFFDWKVLNLVKTALYFIPLIIGLFLVNILRVFLLILLGILTNPQLMQNLFHTYLGMVLFIIYFLLFMKFIYPSLKKKGAK